MTYVPAVNDYVVWTSSNGIVIEGWVYFYDKEYITIEIGVKCKHDEDIAHCPIHEKTHCCVLCYPENWHELKYITRRLSKNHHVDPYASRQGVPFCRQAVV